MQITMDARLILPQMTGIGRYLLGLLGGMKEVCEEDELIIWLQQELPLDHPVWALGNSPLRLVRLPLQHMDWRAQWVVPKLLRQDHPDLFHYPHFDMPWLTPGPYTITIYDLKYLNQPLFFVKSQRLKKIIMKEMLRHAINGARSIITISQFTEDELVKHFKVDPSKIQVVPLGVDRLFFETCPAETLLHVQQKYKLPKDYLLAVGERRPHKNLTGLIEAYHIFIKERPQPYSLVVAGKAYANYREPEKLVEELGLTDKVLFLDYVEDKDLPAIYQMAGLLVNLSLYEGFGLPVLEAMASGIPVLAANLTALPEVVGDCGILVDPSDPQLVAEQIKALVTDYALKGALIENSKQWAKKFTWQNCARQTLQVYHRAVET